MTQMKAKSSSTLLSKAKVSGTHLAPTFSPILEPHFKHTSKTFHCLQSPHSNLLPLDLILLKVSRHSVTSEREAGLGT